MTILRFIPAYAGNTKLIAGAVLALSVHPRLRGEHFLPWDFPAGRVGSSPLTRGTPAAHRAKRETERFIPAYAGNTWVFIILGRIIGGSSPLTRGTPAVIGATAPDWRFIPAYAGNTAATKQGRCLRTVHPRLRGEHTKSKHLIQNSFFPHQKSTNFFRGELPTGCHPDRPLI